MRLTEQEHFSHRLKQILESNGYPTDSPTQLAREFNLRYAGKRITAHGARKWLVGEAIPTQEKLLVLSTWLNVTPEWLRFDGAEPPQLGTSTPANPVSLNADDARMMADFHLLEPKHQQFVRELVGLLARTMRKPSGQDPAK